MMDQNERAAAIQIGGETYELLLTTKATKEIAKRYYQSHQGDRQAIRRAGKPRHQADKIGKF